MQNKKPFGYPLFTHRTDDSETEKKVKYKIELVKKTVDLLQKITRHTYKITKVIYKCGVIQKVIITFVSLVFSLGLRFGSSSSVEPGIPAQTQIEKQLQHSRSTLLLRRN